MEHSLKNPNLLKPKLAGGEAKMKPSDLLRTLLHQEVQQLIELSLINSNT